MARSDDAVFIGGWWIPAHDDQLRATCTKSNPRRPVVDGRVAWQYQTIMDAIGLCKRRGTAVDVGAHVGWWSYWLTKYFDTVAALEPVKLHYDLLKLNVQGDGFYPIHTAAGDGFGTVKMVVPDKTGRSHIGDGEEEAPLMPLDELGFETLDLLKIDVEGFETRVLLGAEDNIRRNKPVIVIEQAGHEELYYGEERDSAMKLLKDWGAVEIAKCNQKGDFFMGWDDE